MCKKILKRKRGVSLSPIAHHLCLEFKVLAASGSLLQLLGSIIFFCLLCLILTMHYKGSPGKEIAVAENGFIVVEGDLSAIFLECDCHITVLGGDAWICIVLTLLLKPTDIFGELISAEHRVLVLLIDLFI